MNFKPIQYNKLIPVYLASTKESYLKKKLYIFREVLGFKEGGRRLRHFLFSLPRFAKDEVILKFI